jgi:xylulokinase
LNVAKSAYILAVDLGTSGCKTALVSVEGEVVGWEFDSVPMHVFANGGAEQDPDAWWATFLSTTKRLIARRIVGAEEIVAIACSTQGECTVPVNEDGEALMHAVSWMDTRGRAWLPKITGGFPRIAGYNAFRLLRWIRLTGGAPSLTGKDPAGHMQLIKYAYPEIYENTHKFLNALDFMNLRLTGRFVATADSILTSWVTDNRDPDAIRYSDTLIAGAGIDRDKLPDIVPCAEVIGTLQTDVAQELGLSPKTSVVAGAIDTTAAAIGSGAVGDYALHACIGTSSWVAAHVPFKKTDLATSLASVPCAVPGRYLLTALQATAGGNLSYLRDNILYPDDELETGACPDDAYERMNQMVEQAPPGSNGVTYAPWIFGERAPVEDPTVRASLFNLSLENSRADVVRAVYEGVALNTRWLMEPVNRFLGQDGAAINLVGGGSLSKSWCQIFADVLGIPVRQVDDGIQANVCGAAFIASAALGHIGFGDISARVSIAEEFEPNPALAGLYGDRYETLIGYYRKNAPMYKRLNG